MTNYQFTSNDDVYTLNCDFVCVKRKNWLRHLIRRKNFYKNSFYPLQKCLKDFWHTGGTSKVIFFIFPLFNFTKKYQTFDSFLLLYFLVYLFSHFDFFCSHMNKPQNKLLQKYSLFSTKFTPNPLTTRNNNTKLFWFIIIAFDNVVVKSSVILQCWWRFSPIYGWWNPNVKYLLIKQHTTTLANKRCVIFNKSYYNWV